MVGDRWLVVGDRFFSSSSIIFHLFPLFSSSLFFLYLSLLFLFSMYLTRVNITYHVSHVKQIIYILDKVVELVVEGSVINGAYPI